MNPAEAEIVHDLPDALAAAIGRVVAAYSRLEHKMLMIVALLLQLQKPEARVALRNGRPTDLLDTALQIFALRDIDYRIDAAKLKSSLEAAKRERDLLAHGVWLKQPHSPILYLQIARGQWSEASEDGYAVNRAVFPQSKPYSDKEANEVLQVIEAAILLADQLGEQVDTALVEYPERFRQPAPILDPLARRASRRRQRTKEWPDSR